MTAAMATATVRALWLSCDSGFSMAVFPFPLTSALVFGASSKTDGSGPTLAVSST